MRSPQKISLFNPLTVPKTITVHPAFTGRLHLFQHHRPGPASHYRTASFDDVENLPGLAPKFLGRSSGKAYLERISVGKSRGCRRYLSQATDVVANRFGIPGPIHLKMFFLYRLRVAALGLCRLLKAGNLLPTLEQFDSLTENIGPN